VIRPILFVVVLAVAHLAAAASPADVEIVLDASGPMHSPGDGGSPIYASVRETVAALVAEAASTHPDLRIGLRLAGGDPNLDSVDSCSATGLILPVTAIDHEVWLRALDDIEPHGLRPLISSVVAALGDLDPASTNRRVVVVTSGDDQCGEGPQQVAAALAAEDHPVELRMVGLGLDQVVLDRFGAVPTRNAANAEDLLAALRWAVLDIEEGPRSTGTLDLRLITKRTESPAARVDLTDQATGATHSDTFVGETRLELPAGRYRLTVELDEGGRYEYRDLLVTAQSEGVVELDLGPMQPVAIDTGTDPVFAGVATWVDVAGSAPVGARLQFVDVNGLAVTRRANPNENDGWSDAPQLVGPGELLLVGKETHGVRRILARRPVTVILGDPGLTAPDEVGVSEALPVGWAGLASDGNFVGLVPRAGTPTQIISCVSVGALTESRLVAPPTSAELDLVYVVGATMSVAARHPLQVTAPKVTVTAPARVAAGERIEVMWRGPEREEDFVTLALAGSPDDEYLEWARVEDGNPSVFRAPGSPGAYEARYVDGERSKIRARAPIEVTAIPITLSAPATTPAGLRFDVAWTGPAAPGDFLAISKPGAGPTRTLDWASTTIGSPITLAAPSKPGAYEIRYVADGGREVLAVTPIEVQE
jgi:Ca-activated chloride channel family protein